MLTFAGMRVTVFHSTRVLAEEDTCDAAERCPVCGHQGSRKRIGFVQRDPRIELLQCQACGGASASRMPRPEVLDAFYRAYYADRHEPALTLHGLEGWARHIARSLPKGGGTALLDFGGGDGSLGLSTARLLDSRMKVTLVDAAGSAAPGVNVSRDLAELGAATFDIVLASAVLEHIPELDELLPRLLDRVRPGGFFYARTPYVAPFMRFLSVDFTYPGHVHDLGPAFWNRLVARFPEYASISSRPSRVETAFSRMFARTFAAHVLKAPARLEVALRGRPRRLFWPFVGGWEVVLQRRASL